MMTFTFEFEAGRGPDWDSTDLGYRPRIICTSATSARLQQALPTLGWGADAAGRPCVAYDEISPVFHSALRGLDLEDGAHLSQRRVNLAVVGWALDALAARKPLEATMRHLGSTIFLQVSILMKLSSTTYFRKFGRPREPRFARRLHHRDE